MRETRVLLGLLLLWLCGGALAEQTLVVNGADVAGLNGRLIPGVAYAPADTYAQAMGAGYSYNPSAQLATFQLGADVAVLKVYASASEAARDKTALQFNGQALAGPGGILAGDIVYVPVKQLAQAFGATVSYLAAQDTVYVLFPRAHVTLQGPTAMPGGSERFTLSVSAPVSVESHAVKAINTVLFRFDHSDAAVAQHFSGVGFSGATLAPTAGNVEFRLTLQPGYTYQSYTAPQGNGFSFVVDIFPAQQKSVVPAAETTVVLDPSHGGQDTGLTFPGVGSESTLTLTFAKRVASALEASGITVKLTRAGDQEVGLESRSRAGIGADLFVSIHALPLPSGQYDLYYLGDAPDMTTLNAAIRQNAQGAVNSLATGSLRRRILLKLIPDLSIGQADAQSLASQLAQSAGFNAKIMSSAPLYVLGGAAGRGLYLEFSPQDLLSQDFAGQFAQALAPLVAAPTSQP